MGMFILYNLIAFLFLKCQNKVLLKNELLNCSKVYHELKTNHIKNLLKYKNFNFFYQKVIFDKSFSLVSERFFLN